MVRQIIRLEGLVVFLASLYFYRSLGASWAMFVLLVLAPDLSMAGYLKGKKFGAVSYNLVHNYALAALLVVYGLMTDNKLPMALGLILTAHIGVDRFLGFGLKYPSDFKNTHLQRPERNSLRRELIDKDE